MQCPRLADGPGSRSGDYTIETESTDITMGAVGAAQPSARMKKMEPRMATGLEGAKRQRKIPIAPQTPVMEVMRGMETSQRSSRLKSQPVWKMLTILPMAVV